MILLIVILTKYYPRLLNMWTKYIHKLKIHIVGDISYIMGMYLGGTKHNANKKSNIIAQ